MNERRQTPSAIRRIAWGLIFGIGGAGAALGGALLAVILISYTPILDQWFRSLPDNGGGWGSFVILSYFQVCVAVAAVVGISAGLFAGAVHPRKSPTFVLWSLIVADGALILYCVSLYPSDRWIVRLAVLFAISAVIKYLLIQGLSRILPVGKRETSAREV